MKKIIYLLLPTLFIFSSCSNQDEIIDVEDGVLNTVLERKNDAVTVIGQNDPTLDLFAVQNALDNHDYIILSGDFDFGDGGVDITRPDVTLQGPANIYNGNKYDDNPAVGGLFYPLAIRAPGVEVRDLTIIGSHQGVLINAEEDGKPVLFEGNTVESFGAGVVAVGTRGGIEVADNSLKALFGYFARETTGPTKVLNNDIEAVLDGVNVFEFGHRLDIKYNNMFGITYTGIWLGAWGVYNETVPEWGENDIIQIVDNHIDLLDLAAGIYIGGSAHGVNKALVKSNILTGYAGYGGLVKGPYGHNNKFINNDLTGLETISPQLWIMGGRDNHFQNNKLGPVAPFIFGEWGFGPALADAATLVSTFNWHKNDFLNTPDPVNYNNHFNNNDYTLTGLTGWSEESESFGAVLLLNFIQQYEPGFVPYEEPFTATNYISELKFPEGTDMCTQIMDLPYLSGGDMIYGNSHIAGWSACEAQGNKTLAQIINDRFENRTQQLNQVEMRKRNHMTRLNE